VSNEATGVVTDEESSSAIAAEAPIPASTQPSRPITSTGRESRRSIGSPHCGSTK
jgi:hypothetical protein